MSNMSNMNNMNIISDNSTDNSTVPCPVSLTTPAVAFISRILAKNPTALGLRLGVKPAGCSGFGYVVDCAMACTQSDRLFEIEGLQIVIDEKSLPYLKGMVVDCVTEGLNQSLNFKNPNATGACGCGESFSVEE